MKNIIIFASGSGTNAQNICEQFADNTSIKVVALFCNNPDAMVIARMKPFNIPVHVFNRETFNNEQGFSALLNQYHPSLLVLAGFLWLIPEYLVKQYPNKIINIHPALLPKFGGKGMYGMNVHRAVIENKEPETGITIHFVNEHYDEGNIIFQKKVSLAGNESPESVAEKVHELEQTHFPAIIEKLLNTKS